MLLFLHEYLNLKPFDSMSKRDLNIRDLTDISDTALIAAIVEAFFYGCYCLIFGQYLQVYRKKKNNKSVLIYPLTLLFFLSTLCFILNLTQTFWLVLRPGTHEIFLWVVDIISIAVYGFVDIISQSILIYRCWIMWNHRPLLVVVPLIMAVTLLGITLVLIVELCRQNPSTSFAHVAPWAIPLAISAICISLASNAISTGLLVLRIALLHRQHRRYVIQAGRSLVDPQVSPIISILIETGMMTFVSQLILVIAFGLRDAYALVVASPMIIIYVGSSDGITPTIIIVRVTMGNSYNNQGTSGTHSIMAFASESDSLQSDIVQTET